MLKSCAGLAILLCFLASAGNALAEGFALYEYSARGIALGGAMTARKPDASAVAYNAALLTRLKGAHLMGGLSVINPSGEMKWKNGNAYETTELRDSLWAIPHAYYVQQINDDWYFGIGEFTRFGLGFEYPHNWPGRFSIYEVSLISASLNPNIAWRATDKLSLAAGVEIVYVTLDLKKRAKTPVASIPGASFEVDSNIQNAEDIGVGFNLATHYQFNDHWAIGIQYRSQVRVHAHGDVAFTYKGSEGVPAAYENLVQQGYASTFRDGSAHSTVILPDSIAAGIAWTPIPELSIEAGAVWTRWSTFRSLNIHLPHGLPTSESHKHWKDVWRFNVGVEYDVLDWLTLRAGYVFDQSPMTEKYEDYLVPTDDRHIYSFGVGFKWDAWTLDLSYAYIDAIGRSYKANPATNVLKSKAEASSTNILSLSIGYSF